VLAEVAAGIELLDPGKRERRGQLGLPPVFDPLAMRVFVGFRGLGWW